MNRDLKFKYGTQESYDAIEEKDIDVFYRTENNVYLGDKKLNNPSGIRDDGGAISINRAGEVGAGSIAIGAHSTAQAVASGAGSFSVGVGTTASDYATHAEGNLTRATIRSAHAEGSMTLASGSGSHSEGHSTTSIGAGSHAEGAQTLTAGNFSHAEGSLATASDYAAHAEGNITLASSTAAHAEGYMTTASGEFSHAEGGNPTHGSPIALGMGSHAEGGATRAVGDNSHAEGFKTTAQGSYSHAEGAATYACTTSGVYTIGSGRVENAFPAHAEGNGNITYGGHAEGYQSTANQILSHVEGFKTYANNMLSHAEGYRTTASGIAAHVEGGYSTSNTASMIGNIASGQNSHAEGCGTTASGKESHAENWFNKASGAYSHVEGFNNIAAGNDAHAEGQWTTAFGASSHSGGFQTYASHYEFVHGNGVVSSVLLPVGVLSTDLSRFNPILTGRTTANLTSIPSGNMMSLGEHGSLAIFGAVIPGLRILNVISTSGLVATHTVMPKLKLMPINNARGMVFNPTTSRIASEGVHGTFKNYTQLYWFSIYCPILPVSTVWRNFALVSTSEYPNAAKLSLRNTRVSYANSTASNRVTMDTAAYTANEGRIKYSGADCCFAINHTGNAILHNVKITGILEDTSDILA